MFEAIAQRLQGVVLLGSFTCLCIDAAIAHPVTAAASHPAAIGVVGIWAGAFVFLISALSTACVVASACCNTLSSEQIYAASQSKWAAFAIAGFVLMAMGLTGFAWSFLLLAMLRFGTKLWADSEI